MFLICTLSPVGLEQSVYWQRPLVEDMTDVGIKGLTVKISRVDAGKLIAKAGTFRNQTSAAQ